MQTVLSDSSFVAIAQKKHDFFQRFKAACAESELVKFWLVTEEKVNSIEFEVRLTVCSFSEIVKLCGDLLYCGIDERWEMSFSYNPNMQNDLSIMVQAVSLDT